MFYQFSGHTQSISLNNSTKPEIINSCKGSRYKMKFPSDIILFNIIGIEIDDNDHYHSLHKSVRHKIGSYYFRQNPVVHS